MSRLARRMTLEKLILEYLDQYQAELSQVIAHAREARVENASTALLYFLNYPGT